MKIAYRANFVLLGVTATFAIGGLIPLSAAPTAANTPTFQRDAYGIVRFTSPNTLLKPSGVPDSIDVAHAREMNLPKTTVAPAPPVGGAIRVFKSRPGAIPGASGNGRPSPVKLPIPSTAESIAGGDAKLISIEGYEHVFTTSRVDLDPSPERSTQFFYPYRAAGKLYFKVGEETWYCSASMIQPGILLTAAHCVAEYGSYRVFSDWTYIPAYDGTRPNTARFGVWTASGGEVPWAWVSGSDVPVGGYIYRNDVAVLVMRQKRSDWVGNKTGWLGFGWDGWGFNDKNEILVSQLGYPSNLDWGQLMQRTDSQGYVWAEKNNNTVIGSNQLWGASGGPWVANLGVEPDGTRPPAAAERNIVIGVSSWISGWEHLGGANPFTTDNILTLVNRACLWAPPGACVAQLPPLPPPPLSSRTVIAHRSNI